MNLHDPIQVPLHTRLRRDKFDPRDSEDGTAKKVFGKLLDIESS